MLTWKRFCIGALAAISVMTGQGPDANTPEARIDELRQQFNAAYNAGNADDLARLLAEDAVFMPPGAPAVAGRDAVRARYAAQFGNVTSIFTLNAGEIRVSGNLAWLRGGYQRVDTALAGGLSSTTTGKYLMTFRNEDNDWKITTDAWNANETPLQVDARIALHCLRALAEWRLRDVAGSLKLLASTSQVKTGDWRIIKPLLANLGNTGILANAIWFVRPDGFYYSVELDYTGLNLTARSYFPGLMAGRSVLGTLVVSLSTGKRSVIIAEPVFDQSQRVMGGVGVSYSVDQLSLEADRQMQLPVPVVFYALDLSGQTALHRDPALMFEYPSDMGSPSLRSAVDEMLAQESGAVTYMFREMRKTILYERSAPLGWVFALGFSEPAAGEMR